MLSASSSRTGTLGVFFEWFRVDSWIVSSQGQKQIHEITQKNEEKRRDVQSPIDPKVKVWRVELK